MMSTDTVSLSSRTVRSLAVTFVRCCADWYKRRAQLQPQLRPDHLQQVVRGFAADELQEPARALRHVHDLVVLVDDHGGRRVLLEEPEMEVGE